MFFKKNEVQESIDSFKMMQEKLGAATRNARSDQREEPTNPSAASQRTPEMDDKTANSIFKGLMGGESDHQHSVVSGEATWEGKLRTEASARIEGTISGEIEAGETVFIATGAHVRANVQARRVVVAGELEGQITCREELVVEQSGRLEGKVSTKTLVIEEGAVVQSQIQMLGNDKLTKEIAKELLPWEEANPSPLGKTNGRQSKTGPAGSPEPKLIELLGENGGK